ncbi:MAG: hypothetical protein MHM6MM_003688 [Cercozoa sp. M6MM]
MFDNVAFLGSLNLLDPEENGIGQAKSVLNDENHKWIKLPALKVLSDLSIGHYAVAVDANLKPVSGHCPFPPDFQLVNSFEWTADLHVDEWFSTQKAQQQLVQAIAGCVLPESARALHSTVLKFDNNDPFAQEFLSIVLRNIVSLNTLDIQLYFTFSGTGTLFAPQLRWVTERLSVDIMTGQTWSVQLPRLELVGEMSLQVRVLAELDMCSLTHASSVTFGGMWTADIDAFFRSQLYHDGDGGFVSPQSSVTTVAMGQSMPPCRTAHVPFVDIVSTPPTTLSMLDLPDTVADLSQLHAPVVNSVRVDRSGRLWGVSLDDINCGPLEPSLVFVGSTDVMARGHSEHQMSLSLMSRLTLADDDESMRRFLSAAKSVMQQRVIVYDRYSEDGFVGLPIASRGYVFARCVSHIALRMDRLNMTQLDSSKYAHDANVAISLPLRTISGHVVRFRGPSRSSSEGDFPFDGVADEQFESPLFWETGDHSNGDTEISLTCHIRDGFMGLRESLMLLTHLETTDGAKWDGTNPPVASLPTHVQPHAAFVPPFRLQETLPSGVVSLNSTLRRAYSFNMTLRQLRDMSVLQSGHTGLFLTLRVLPSIGSLEMPSQRQACSFKYGAVDWCVLPQVLLRVPFPLVREVPTFTLDYGSREPNTVGSVAFDRVHFVPPLTWNTTSAGRGRVVRVRFEFTHRYEYERTEILVVERTRNDSEAEVAIPRMRWSDLAHFGGVDVPPVGLITLRCFAWFGRSLNDSGDMIEMNPMKVVSNITFNNERNWEPLNVTVDIDDPGAPRRSDLCSVADKSVALQPVFTFSVFPNETSQATPACTLEFYPLLPPYPLSGPPSPTVSKHVIWHYGDPYYEGTYRMNVTLPYAVPVMWQNGTLSEEYEQWHDRPLVHRHAVFVIYERDHEGTEARVHRVTRADPKKRALEPLVPANASSGVTWANKFEFELLRAEGIPTQQFVFVLASGASLQHTCRFDSSSHENAFSFLALQPLRHFQTRLLAVEPTAALLTSINEPLGVWEDFEMFREGEQPSQIRVVDRVPPVGRLVFDLVTSVFRHYELCLGVNELPCRPFIQAACRNDSDVVCDNVSYRRYVTDFLSLNSDGSLRNVTLTLKYNELYELSHRMYAWPQLSFFSSAETRDVYGETAAFQATVTRSASRVLSESRCRSEYYPYHCGGSIKCYGVVACSVDLFPEEDSWVLVAGTGFKALSAVSRFGSVRASLPMSFEGVARTGSADDWDNFDVSADEPDGVARQVLYGARVVDLDDVTSLKTFFDEHTDGIETEKVPMHVLRHLVRLTQGPKKFGLTDPDVLIQDRSAIIFKTPRGFEDVFIELGVTVWLSGDLPGNLEDPSLSYGDIPNTVDTNFCLNGDCLVHFTHRFYSWSDAYDGRNRLITFDGVVFLEFQQRYKSGAWRNCEKADLMLSSCERNGGVPMQLVAYKLDSAPNVEFAVRFVDPVEEAHVIVQDVEVIYEAGVDTTMIYFELPRVPRLIYGNDTYFSVELLGRRDELTTTRDQWLLNETSVTPTGYYVSFAPCNNYSAPDLETLECLPCLPGEHSMYGQPCRKCPAGTYAVMQPADEDLSDLSNAPRDPVKNSTCVTCGIFSFSLEGWTRCEDCYGPSSLDERGTPLTGLKQCEPCREGTYTPLAFDQSPARVCIECPKGAKCVGDQVFSQAGYYVQTDPATGIVKSTRCKAGHCLPGNSCPIEPTLDGRKHAQSCCSAFRLDHRSNPMCGTCEPGAVELNGSCLKCEIGDSMYRPVISFLVMIGYVGVVHFLAQNLRDATVRITMYYLQMLRLFEGAFDKSLSSWLLRFFYGVFDMDVSFVDPQQACVGYATPLSHMLVPFLKPILLLTSLTIFLGLYHMVRLWRTNEGFTNATQSVVMQVRRTSLYIVVSSLASIMDKLIHLLLGCRKLTVDETRLVRRYPMLDCASDTYFYVQLIAGVVAIFIFSLPFYYVYQLRKMQERGVLFTRWGQRFFGIFTEVYRPSLYMWEMVALARRMSMILLMFGFEYLLSDDELLMALMMISLVSLLVHVYLMPYRRVTDNIMETMVLSLHVMILFGFIMADDPMSPVQMTIYRMSVMITSLLLFVTVYVVKNFSIRLRRAHKQAYYTINGEVIMSQAALLPYFVRKHRYRLFVKWAQALLGTRFLRWMDQRHNYRVRHAVMHLISDCMFTRGDLLQYLRGGGVFAEDEGILALAEAVAVENEALLEGPETQEKPQAPRRGLWSEVTRKLQLYAEEAMHNSSSNAWRMLLRRLLARTLVETLRIQEAEKREEELREQAEDNAKRRRAGLVELQHTPNTQVALVGRWFRFYIAGYDIFDTEDNNCYSNRRLDHPEDDAYEEENLPAPAFMRRGAVIGDVLAQFDGSSRVQMTRGLASPLTETQSEQLRQHKRLKRIERLKQREHRDEVMQREAGHKTWATTYDESGMHDGPGYYAQHD